MSEKDKSVDEAARWAALAEVGDGEGGFLASSVGVRVPETGVFAGLSLEEQEKKRKKEQIGADLDLVLARVPRNLRDNAEGYERYKKERREAKERLKGHGIDLDRYLTEGIQVGTREGNEELGKRKTEMRRVLAKMREGEELTKEEREIVEQVGINEEVTVVKKKDEEIETAPAVIAPVNSGAARGIPLSGVERSVRNIEGYTGTTIKTQREAFENLRSRLVRQGAQQGEINIVLEAMKRLAERENRDIAEATRRGEMRVELKTAVESFYREMESVYSQNVNMINGFSMDLSEGRLKNALEEIRKTGADGEALAGVLEVEMRNVGILHDLRLMVNANRPVDQMMSYANQLKGVEFDSLIHMQNRTVTGERDTVGGNDYVIRCLAEIDREARETYQNPNKVFSLEDPSLEGRILARAKGNRLYYLIARDLYRVTGGEARYGVAAYAHQDAARNNAWVIERNEDGGNGSIFRKALNGRREAAGSVRKEPPYYLTYNPLLWEHMDPAVTSFWENLWSRAKKTATGNPAIYSTVAEIGLKKDSEVGIAAREYATLTVDALRSLRLGEDNEIGFSKWLENMGNNAEAMGKESKFMQNPSFKSFQATFGDEYKYAPRYREGRPIERRDYFLERLGDLVRFSLNNNMSRSAISAELNKYLEGGYLFGSEDELNRFKKKHEIPTNFSGSLVSDMGDLGEMLGNGGSDSRKAWGVIGDFLKGLTGLGK